MYICPRTKVYARMQYNRGKYLPITSGTWTAMSAYMEMRCSETVLDPNECVQENKVLEVSTGPFVPARFWLANNQGGPPIRIG